MTQLTEAHFELHSANKAKMKNMNDFYNNTNKVMIVDGDLVIYKITSGLEEAVNWGDDIWTLHADLAVGKQYSNKIWNGIKIILKSKEIIIAFSDKLNYRKALDKDYKSYRKKIRKPICYAEMRKWVQQNYNFYVLPNSRR